MYSPCVLQEFLYIGPFANTWDLWETATKSSTNSKKPKVTLKVFSVNNLKKYRVKFTGENSPDVKWEFEPVEKEVVVGAGETAIVFYKLYNKEDKPIVGFSVYNISP